VVPGPFVLNRFNGRILGARRNKVIGDPSVFVMVAENFNSCISASE
jgi:hypothetical protein